MRLNYEEREISAHLVLCEGEADEEKVSFYALNPPPIIFVNREEAGYRLLSDATAFLSARKAGREVFTARVYKLTEKDASIFSLLHRLKGGMDAMEEAYAMKTLVDEYRFTQEKIARWTGKSRPAIANTLRLLTLSPEVIGLIESKKLSAGHARALVKVPKEKQYPFALQTIERKSSVRETERAVKAFLTPPEVLKKQKAKEAEEREELLKSIVERARLILMMNVSLIGSDKKGRIYVDYQTTDELYRFDEALSIIEEFYKK